MAETGAQLFDELMRFRPDGLSPNAWAVKAGVSRTIWQDLRRHGNPSRRTMEKLLGAAGSSLAEFEALRIGKTNSALEIEAADGVGETGRGYRGAELPPIPLVWCQPSGEWADGITQIELEQTKILGRLPRPVSLVRDPNAYALAVPDRAMWPRFRPGRHIAVSPVASIEPGDDVLVMIAGTRWKCALVKELVGRSADSLTLRQFTPDLTFGIRLVHVGAVHKVLGEMI